MKTLNQKNSLTCQKTKQKKQNKGSDKIRGASQCELKFMRALAGATLGVALRRPVFTRSG